MITMELGKRKKICVDEIMGKYQAIAPKCMDLKLSSAKENVPNSPEGDFQKDFKGQVVENNSLYHKCKKLKDLHLEDVAKLSLDDILHLGIMELVKESEIEDLMNKMKAAMVKNDDSVRDTKVISKTGNSKDAIKSKVIPNSDPLTDSSKVQKNTFMDVFSLKERVEKNARVKVDYELILKTLKGKIEEYMRNPMVPLSRIKHLYWYIKWVESRKKSGVMSNNLKSRTIKISQNKTYSSEVTSKRKSLLVIDQGDNNSKSGANFNRKQSVSSNNELISTFKVKSSTEPLTTIPITKTLDNKPFVSSSNKLTLSNQLKPASLMAKTLNENLPVCSKESLSPANVSVQVSNSSPVFLLIPNATSSQQQVGFPQNQIITMPSIPCSISPSQPVTSSGSHCGKTIININSKTQSVNNPVMPIILNTNIQPVSLIPKTSGVITSQTVQQSMAQVNNQNLVTISCVGSTQPQVNTVNHSNDSALVTSKSSQKLNNDTGNQSLSANSLLFPKVNSGVISLVPINKKT